MSVSVQPSSRVAKTQLTRRQILTAGMGLAAMPLMSGQVFAAANDSFAKAPYRASTAEQKLNIISLDRLEVEARSAIPKEGYAFVSGAAGAEWTKNENKRAFTDYRIAAKRLMGLTANDIDVRTKLLGLNLSSPVIVAPMGAHGMVHEMAEKDTAKGAGLANALYVSSGASNATLEEIAQATNAPKWFQLYYNRDEAVTRSLLTRAKKAGYSAIVLTADALGPGQSEDFLAMGSPFRPDMGFANHDPKKGGFGNFKDQKTNLTPKDIQFIKQFTG